MSFQSPTSFAHLIWSKFLSLGSITIDATCGNGYDTLFLAEKTLNERAGRLYAFDIQEKALEKTDELLSQSLSKKVKDRIKLIHDCHKEIDSYCQEEVDLIVFNLGYLPGSDKSITTLSKTTLISLNKSLTLLKKGGFLSIMCYPGHEEGFEESKKVLEWAKNLERNFCTTQHSWINRSISSPFLLLINKL